MSYGKFHGDVVARWLRHVVDDRNMELLEDFACTDPSGKKWVAPRGSVVDGASIPAALWSTIGPPFVGDYRRASVIHDVACEEKQETHQAVHLAFYYAMRADGVGWVKANMMYQAVKRFGPRWSRVGANLKPHQQPTDAAVLDFIQAVEAAAREVPEDQGLDAVQRRADELLLAGKQPPRAPSTSDRPARAARGESSRGVSRVKLRDRRDNREGSHLQVQAFDSGQVSPAVRGFFDNACCLGDFRRIIL